MPLLSQIKGLISEKEPKVGSTFFVAVDGHGGSGKSTFARLLADALGAQLITQDDFASWDNPLNWWPSVIEKVFKPIQNGVKTISYERSQWWPNHKPEPVKDMPITPIMVLEGVSSSRSEFRDYISLSIFIDTPEDVCLLRGVQRDLDAKVGKTKEEITAMWLDWIKEENTYFTRDNPKGNADIVIDGNKPFVL